MAAKKIGLSLDLIIHPGETIADILEARSISQKELAIRTGVSEAYISDVINGKKNISTSFAQSLEYALSVPTSFWVNLQANYDAELIAYYEGETITQEERNTIPVLKEVITFLKDHRGLQIPDSIDKLILALRSALCISNLSSLSSLVPTGAYRMEAHGKLNPIVLGAWLCLCQQRSHDVNTDNCFTVQNADEVIIKLKQLMSCPANQLQQKLSSLLAEYGIDFSIVRNFTGAPVHGYIRQKPDGTYQMAVTLRRAYADIFWFSLFHELGHIVNGDIKKTGQFIDANQSSTREDNANLFARNALIDESDYQMFIMKNNFDIKSISNFAGHQGVPPYIVIGRLQKESIIPYPWYKEYKVRYKWAQ